VPAIFSSECGHSSTIRTIEEKTSSRNVAIDYVTGILIAALTTKKAVTKRPAGKVFIKGGKEQ